MGATTSTQLTSPTTETGLLRCLNITAGQLYASGNLNTPRIGSVGTGLPNTAGQTITNLPGFSETGLPGQFILLDLDAGVAGPDVLYCADDGSGIEKFSLVSGNWVSNGVVGASVDDYRGFAAKVTGTTVTIYATRRGANNTNIKGGQVVSLTDASGYNSAFSATPVVLITATTNLTAFRGVAAAPVLNPLPIKLVSFSADKLNKDVRLTWTATDAVQFSHFEVERSMDRMTFSVIGNVPLQQTGNANTSYNFSDVDILSSTALKNTIYYRLKMIDTDGHIDYSKIVTVVMVPNTRRLVTAYPDPFIDDIYIKTDMATAGKINLSLSDVRGRVVRTMNIFQPVGVTPIKFTPPAHLEKGIYFLRVEVNDKITTLKLIK